jgi:hypothetical protein
MSLRRRVLGTVAGTALLLSTPLLAASASPQAAPAAATHAVAAASAKKLVVVEGGRTMLALNPATAKVLTENKVSVALAGEARSLPSGLTFPISGGLVTPALVGTIKHTGGLTFIAGGKQLTAQDFIINTATGRLTAYIVQAKVRIPLLDLSLAKAKVTAKGNVVIVANVKATLDATAATALDGYFGTKLFAGGLPIGTARVQASVLAVTS